MTESRGPGFTFIHYGNEYNLAYRQEAREHNARKRAANNKNAKQKLLEQRRRVLERQASSDQPKAEVGRYTPDGADSTAQEGGGMQQKTLIKSSLQTPLTSFHRDQFSCYPISMSSDDYRLESEWFSMFQDVLFLPKLPPSSQIPRPQEVFFSSALVSGASYQSLIQLPAATARAGAYRDPGNTLQQAVFRLQAEALRTYRSLITRLQESESLTKADFETMFALTFAFIDQANDSKNARQQAYHAMLFSNLRMVVQKREHYHSNIAIVEWIATMMPVPGANFPRDEKYKAFFKAKIEGYLGFLEEAQIHTRAQSISQDSQRIEAFRSGTAMRDLLTMPSGKVEARQPHSVFVPLCRVRALNYIHLNLVGLAGRDQARKGEFFTTIENIAKECINFEPAKAIALFLWGLLTVPENNGLRQFAQQEELFNVPSKNLLAMRGISFVSEMTAWLLHESNDEIETSLPLLDFTAIKDSLFPP